MRKYTRIIAVSAAAAALTCLAVTGCGQARPDGGTETTSETVAPAVTEAPIVIQTEAPQTEPETQPQTQPETAPPETQPQTQPETVPPTEAVLSADEELAQENDYDEWITMFANADINIRQSPSTDTQDNIVSSFDRGEEATIIGETATWYKIYKEYDPVTEISELTGFVKKEYMSPSYEEAMTERPQETAAAPAQTPETAAQEVPAAETAPAQTPETAAPAAQPEQAAAPASTASGPAVTINSDANIRADAYDTADVVGVVNAGTQVTQIGSADGWIQIDYNGTQGYVKASLVG